MIESINCMGILMAEALTPNHKAAMISILDPSHDKDFSLPGWREGRILSLRFDDLVHDLFPKNSPYVLFDSDMAGQIIEFVRQLHESSEPANLYVHCMAGVSRSAAVAYWVHRTFGVRLPRDFRMRTRPNVRVFELLSLEYLRTTAQPAEAGW